MCRLLTTGLASDLLLSINALHVVYKQYSSLTALVMLKDGAMQSSPGGGGCKDWHDSFRRHLPAAASGRDEQHGRHDRSHC